MHAFHGTHMHEANWGGKHLLVAHYPVLNMSLSRKRCKSRGPERLVIDNVF